MNWTRGPATCAWTVRSDSLRCARRFTVSFRKRFAATKWPQLCAERTGQTGIEGDGDPMDICVLTEKTFAHGSFFLHAKPIGGLRMIDGQQADDKIIAVLESDLAYGHIEDIGECPKALVDRLKHYFLSYKQLPGERRRRVRLLMFTIGRRRSM